VGYAEPRHSLGAGWGVFFPERRVSPKSERGFRDRVAQSEVQMASTKHETVWGLQQDGKVGCVRTNHHSRFRATGGDSPPLTPTAGCFSLAVVTCKRQGSCLDAWVTSGASHTATALLLLDLVGPALRLL
jgi:hypothetical protein